ncbi:MAG: immunoglobulin domain-containing protein [Verrucomicrobia bacterium]|nr:immunoglobulin domain-containing protein [Verrucomicrobiota bacterium]
MSSRLILGREVRDVFSGFDDISEPIAFKDNGSRTLVLGGTGRGDNTLLLELRDKSYNEVSGLTKLGAGTWVLGKASPYSGLTNINEGILTVTTNDALGTVSQDTTVTGDTFTGNFVNGTEVTFPSFFDTVLPGGVVSNRGYYVVGSTGTTFQIAATLGGTALPISTPGLNVRLVPKLDSFRSTTLDIATDRFVGNLVNGEKVSFNTQLVAGQVPQLPLELLTNTYYYVVNAGSGTFQVSLTPEPSVSVVDFTTQGTPGSLYYTIPTTGNPSGGVNLTSGTLLLSNVDYRTPETLNFEGGTLAVPADSSSTWAGIIRANTQSNIRIGQGGTLTLTGSMIGTGRIIQDGEGTLILQGETLMPTSNALNSSRHFDVRSGSLVLDYAFNNGSKLVDNAILILGGSRRGGEVRLTGGNHEEIVGRTILDSGANSIYRDSGLSTIRLNAVERRTGSSLYLDTGRLAKTDQPNSNNILGAWAIIRDAITNAFWVIPGTSSYSYEATAEPSNNQLTTRNMSGTAIRHTLANGTLVRFTTTGVMPGGLSANTNYYVTDTSGSSASLSAGTFQVLASANAATPVDITSQGSGTLTVISQIAFTVNPQSDTMTSVGEHRLAKGGIVRVSSYGILPGGLSAGVDYYVTDVAARSFRLSNTVDGPPVNITDIGTGVHTVDGQGSEKRVGSSALIFTAESATFPASDGNGKIKIRIEAQPGTGPITATLLGAGTLLDPYIYTIFTTNNTNGNSNNDVVAFVNADSQRANLFRADVSGGNTFVNSVVDTGSYGSPTFLANGSYDNGGNELDWARNEGSGGSSFNDGFIMPSSSYAGTWLPTSNTAVTRDINVPQPAPGFVRDTYSLRFATQNASSVNLNNTGVLNSIISGGILVSPTVGANDSGLNGNGLLSTKGESNMQNLIIHQYNELGSLNIGAKITDRASFQREGRLTGFNRTLVTFSDLSGVSVGQIIAGVGIPANTRVTAIDIPSGVITLSANHDGIVRAAAVNYTFSHVISGVASTSSSFDLVLNSVANLAVGFEVSGAGITNGTLITAINTNTNTVTIDTVHDGLFRTPSVSYSFVSAVRAGVASDPNRRFLAGVTPIKDLTPGMTLTGPGIIAGTTVVAVDKAKLIVTLSRDHDGIYGRGDFIFAGSISCKASTGSADRRTIIGVVKPGNGIPADPSEIGLLGTSDLYIGMPISGPGIPFGSTVTAIFNDCDIQVSSNHFFTGEATTLNFTPNTGIEKLGPGSLVLNGNNQYTGVTYIGAGSLRAQTLTDGGVSGSLGLSSAASTNLVFNGAELQYVGENAKTNRGFQIFESAILNIGHEKTSAAFSGAILGSDRLEKKGSGTLVFNGNASLESIRVQEGRLLLQTVDTNPSPGTFSPSNFAQSNLTSLRLAGGVLELRGTPEGDVNQRFGSTFVVEEGGSEIKVTSVASVDPTNLVAVPRFRTTTLTLMGQEEGADIVRYAGGTVQFTYNTEENAGPARTVLNTLIRNQLLPWATYRDLSNQFSGGVNSFAKIDTTTGIILSAKDRVETNTSSSDWAVDRFDVDARDHVGENNLEAFTGVLNENRYVGTLSYASSIDSTLTINAGKTLELLSGAILAGFDVNGANKQIIGPGSITGGARNDINSDFIMHNYNPGAVFRLGASIVDRPLTAEGFSLAGGSLKAGQKILKLKKDASSPRFFQDVRPGMRVTGPGIANGTVVTDADFDASKVSISLAAESDQTGQLFTFTESINFVHTGIGTTILSGDNAYTGKTFVHGGVLRLDSANALPGGTDRTGGTSSLILKDGVLGLGYADFNRILGATQDKVEFKGSGGFAAYGADRSVNLGGGSTPESLRFGNSGFVPDGSSLIFGSLDASHKINFLNPLDLGSFSQVIRVEDGPANIEAELAGQLSGLGRLIKFGLGTLRLGVSNANSGGVEIADGRLIAADVPDVFGISSGPVRLGTSRTNTTTGAGIDLELEGGTVSKKLEIGSVNSAGGAWLTGGIVDSAQASVDVGSQSSTVIVDGTPSIAYYDATNKDLKYVHASDARGTSWNVPVTLASRGDVGKSPSLQVINGNPAVTYYDETNKTLMYVRATDVAGAVWGAPAPILAPNVLAVATQPDGKILVAGSFTRFDGDEDKKRIVRFTSDGTLDSTFDNALIQNGEIRDILVQADGKIIIGGTFTTVRVNKTATNDVTRNRLARLNTDGSLDTSFNPNLNGDVRVIVPQADGKFLVGGSFTTVGGVVRSRMALLNSNGSLDTSFRSPDIRNGEVRAIAVHNPTLPTARGTYVIGGTFTSVRGTDNRNRLARVELNGDLDTTFNPDANSDVNAVVVLADNKLLVGGAFSAFVGGVQTRTRLARLNESGSLDNSFAQEVNGTVNRLVRETSGTVLVSGNFSILGDFNRSFMGRLDVNGNVDASFDPNPDFEVRDFVTQNNDQIILGGQFLNCGGASQKYVARLQTTGLADAGFLRQGPDFGKYNALLSVNGNPAVSYYDGLRGNLEYVRSSDVNGANWPNPQLIDTTGDVGVGISMIIGNIGGDILVKDLLGTPLITADDDVTISSTPAIIGTPVIAYGDATNSRLKYVVADTATGDAFSSPVRNWSTPLTVPGTGAVGAHFSLRLVDGYPAIAYQSSDSKDLKFIRAKNEAGIKNNIRDAATLVIRKIKFPTLLFTISDSWNTPVNLDTVGDVGEFPSLALVNGQPTTDKSRPAVSYYDRTNGDLKIIVANTSEGTTWGQSMALATLGDAGQSSTLLMTDGLQAVAYYNSTNTGLAFLIRSDASGYSRISFTGDTTWTGAVSLNGSATFAPAAGRVATLSGAITGPSGIRLVGEGILNLTNAANAFGTSILSPGVGANSSASVNGAVIIRSGSLHVGNSTALGSGLVELGDSVPVILAVDRATKVQSVLNSGGYFSTEHNGATPIPAGPGAFVKVGANIDGRYYGLYSSIADEVTNRFSGPATNGMAIQFFGFEIPEGVSRETTYFVRDKTVDGFKVASTPTGPAINLTSSGLRFYYLEESTLSTTILVKDERDHPEQNGLYRFVVDSDVSSLDENLMNLVRLATFDEASEMRYGSRVNVLTGSSAGKSFFLQADVNDPNLSAVTWSDEAAGASRAILASVSGLNISNSIDLNVSLGSSSSTLGVLSSITSGQVTFSGGLKLQSLTSGREDLNLSITSAITSGPGLVYEGLISEASGGVTASSDRLSLTKVGPGVLTLKANNTFSGGITINQGTLLVMNTKVLPSDSGTGSGTVAINAGAVLGGTGSIAGAVNLTGTDGNQATLRPGDPNSSSMPVELLTINQPITVGPHSVIEFSIGVSNMTKLAGTTINLSTETSRIVVQADPSFLPAAGTEFDLLDFNAGGLTVFGGLSNLLNLLQLPAATVWNTSQFLTTGKITSAGNAVPVVITTHPVGQTVTQGADVTFSVQFTGTGPNTFQWYKDNVPVLGATNQTLLLNGVTQAEEGSYTVRVFSPLNSVALGGVQSNPATLTVDWPLSFALDLDPTMQGSIGHGITLRVIMNGEGTPINYQWKKNGSDVGTNSSTLTLSALSSADVALYSVVVTAPALSTKPVNSVTSRVCSLTIIDGPTATGPVSPAPVAEGGDLELSATISGDPSTTTIQWLRNGAPVPGANSPTLTLCGVTVASSGDYTVRVTGPGPNGKPITSTSSPATTVLIVDNAAKIVAGQLGKTVTLTANAGSTPKVKPTYQWRKNGAALPGDGRFTGGLTKSLKITNLNFNDTDVYTCRITGAPGTAVTTAGTTYLRVYDQAPVVVASPTPPKGMVGGFYSWKIPVTSDVPVPSSGPNPQAWRATPATYAVTGLPAGLKVNPSTGVISGYPTAANTTINPLGYRITITVTNLVKPAAVVAPATTTTNITTAVIDIKPLPAGIVGTYVGAISRDISNGNLGGRFDMSVAATGAITGKVTAGGVAARSFKGGFNISLDNAGGILGLIGTKIMLPGVTGAAAMDLQLDLQTTAAVAPSVAPSTLIVNGSAKSCGAVAGAVITGWRNKWATKAVVGVSDVPTAYAGTPLIPAIAAKPATDSTPAVPAVPAVPATTGPYNFLMALPDGDPLLSNAFVPKGTGYASFTVSTAGAATIAGRTADGMPITGSYLVGPTGQLFFFQSLYTTVTKGSILGNLQIELAASPLDNDVSGDFSWVRPPDPAAVSATKSRLYRSGFGTTQVAPGVPATTVTTPVQLIAFGGRYVAPPTTGTAPLKVLMGLDPFDPKNPLALPNAELVFTESGVGTPVVVGDRDPNIDVMIAARSATSTPAFKEPTATNSTPNPNPAATRVTPTATTGAFTGSFTLIDPVSGVSALLRRPVTFQGLIIRERTSAFNVLPRVTRTYGQGYFIINQLPISGQSATLTPQLSGIVEFKGQ